MSSSPEQAATAAITFRSTIPIKLEDFDYLIMFLESRKQSGGGDISLTSKLDPRTFKVVYESWDACDRILKKRFLKFKNYLLITSLFDRNNNGNSADVAVLMKKTFEPDTKTVIIKNLNVSDEAGKNDDNTETVKLYGEHLVPETNNIAGIVSPHFLAEVFYVTYEREIDRAFLRQRYEKKPLVRQKRIELYDAFVTNTFVICSKQKTQAKKHNANLVKSRIVSTIRDAKKSSGEEGVCYFVESSTNYILLEFRDKVDDNLIRMLKTGLSELDQSLTVESLPNFELLKFVDETGNACFEIQTVSESTTTTSQPVKVYTNSGRRNIPTALLPTPKASGS